VSGDCFGLSFGGTFDLIVRVLLFKDEQSMMQTSSKSGGVITNLIYDFGGPVMLLLGAIASGEASGGGVMVMFLLYNTLSNFILSTSVSKMILAYKNDVKGP